MKLLLNYLFSEKFETTRSELLVHYDSDFIDNKVFEPLKTKF